MEHRIERTSDYLYHHGIKGQRWGIRRYQNADGTWTEAGKKRYGSKDGDSDDNGWFDRTINQGKDKPKVSPAESVAKNTKKIVDDSSDIYKETTKKKRDEKLKKKVSEMSDEELRKEINRLNMERQYKDLKQTDIDTGADKVERILRIAGDVVAIGVSAVTIISTVNSMKHYDDENGLYHHGIKGQKWGVRRYQNEDGTWTEAGKERYGSSKGSSTAKGMELDPELVTLATYAVATAAMYVGIVVSQKQADKRRTKAYQEDYIETSNVKSLESCPRQDPSKMSMDEHMAAINPGYPKGNTTNNCMFCTTAMVMRMKGYDVKANTSPDGWSEKNLYREGNFEGWELIKPKVSSTNALNKRIVADGEGTYGNLMIYGKYGGGHSLFYRVENGRTMVYDCQSNEKYDIKDLTNLADIRQTQYIRMDNCEPNDYVRGALDLR